MADARREDANYRLVHSGDTFTFVDKRTGHKYQFNDCVENGYGDTVFLYHYPTAHVEDPSPTVGFKCGYLDKESLPDWLLTEFEHIDDEGAMTPATDPR